MIFKIYKIENTRFVAYLTRLSVCLNVVPMVSKMKHKTSTRFSEVLRKIVFKNIKNAKKNFKYRLHNFLPNYAKCISKIFCKALDKKTS